ncbi:hypothetical protein LCGC14_1523800 [marine sediment metagenome]|uniref:Uncharacterized protein n=1 Tax=marine sediment metagenome TaxID=412755 RepID=A0A0F9IXX2_9ZZZZ
MIKTSDLRDMDVVSLILKQANLKSIIQYGIVSIVIQCFLFQKVRNDARPEDV